jgi:hypothetical protein
MASKLLQLAPDFAADDNATSASGGVVVEHRLHRPCMNHNETVLAARPAGRGINGNHNETVLAARATGRGINGNHNETVLTAGQARNS